MKIILRQTVAREDHNAARKSGNSQSQTGACCLAVSLVGDGTVYRAARASAKIPSSQEPLSHCAVAAD